MKTKLTEIQIMPVKPYNGLVAFASLVFDNCLYIGSIGIYTRTQGGYRLTYPTRSTQSQSFNIFHPINKEIATQIEEAVVLKYEEVMKNNDRYSETSIR